MSDNAKRSIGPAVADTWYPADRAALSATLTELLTEPRDAPPQPRHDRIVALIAPHAGFAHSGRVAGAGFRHLEGMEFETVMVLGPSHYEGFRGGVVPRATEYRTPLGSIELDTDATRSISQAEPSRIQSTDRPFIREHSIEAELPFLQRTLAEGWRLIPLLVGSDSSETDLTSIANSLLAHVTPSTLIVVSSDFTHYGAHFGFAPFPNDHRVEERIRALDLGAIERIVAQDAVAFRDYLDRTGATVCGHAAIEVLLHLLPERAAGHLVSYDTSGRMSGAWDYTVSYASLLFGTPAPGAEST